jgi:hypothetical protein
MSLSNTRWARGSFRLWIFTSILWVAAVSGLFGSNYPNENNYAYVMTSDDGKTTTISDVFTAADRARAAGDIDAETKLTTFASEKLLILQSAQSNALKSWVLTSFLPPIMLLVLGVGFAWIFRGFRGDSDG